MKKFLMLLLLAFAGPAQAKEMAFMCFWPGGDVIFTASVKPDQEELTSTVEDGVGSIRIKLTDLKSKKSIGSLTVIGAGKITTYSAKCNMAEE